MPSGAAPDRPEQNRFPTAQRRAWLWFLVACIVGGCVIGVVLGSR